MKIAILGTRGIPANYSGFETCVQETSTLFSNEGHIVRVYCRKGRVGTQRDSIGNIETIYVPFIAGKHLETISHTFLSIIHLMFNRVDVVHLYGAGNGWFVPFLRILDFNVIFLIDGIDWDRAKWSVGAKWFLKQGARIGTWSARKSVADSEKVIDRLREELPSVVFDFVPYGAKILTSGAHCLSTLASFGLAPEEYFLFVGRFVPEKNVHLLVDAFKHVKTHRKLVLVGGASYNNEYEQLIRTMAGPNVVFPGRVFGSDYEHILLGCYVYIQPSVLEGTSPSLLAAMGAGSCVLVSDIPENKETVNDAGFYFESDNSESLAEMLSFLDKNRPLVAFKRLEARVHVEKKYSWSVVASQLLELSV